MKLAADGLISTEQHKMRRSWWADLKDAAGQFFTPLYARGRNWSLAMFPGTRFDYEKAVGDGLLTNVFVAPILFVARNFSQARLGVRRVDTNGKAEIDTDHPLAKLLRRPNPFYSGMALWIASLFSWFLDGNIYWIKVRGAGNEVVELWYAPHWLIEPRGDDKNPKVFIKDYAYRPGTETHYLQPSEVVHMRFGIDPRNPRKGYGTLKAVLSVAYIDNAAINMVAAVLRNKGIGGILISPDKDVVVPAEDAEATKEYIRTQTTGDNAGNPLILQGSTKVAQLGFTPSELDLKTAHDIAEERVCAIMGIPASIVGFGAGKSQPRVGATIQEQRKISWSDCIGPNQDMIASELERSLLPDFGEQDGEVDWDRSGVDALQDDMAAKSKRLLAELLGGARSLGSFQEEIGLDVDEDHRDIYYVPFNVTPTKGNELIVEESTTPPPPVAGQFLPGQQPPPKPGDPALPPPAAVPAAAPAPAAPGKPKAAFKHRLTAKQSAILKAFDKLNKRMAPALKGHVRGMLDQLGEAAAHAYRSVAKSAKDASSDEVTVRQMFDSLDVPAFRHQLRADLGAHYVSVSHASIDLAAGLGIVIDQPDPIQVELLKLGGTRAGLIDLTEPARQKVMDLLAEARSRGLGIDDTARMIRDAVPAGPWDSVEYRADLIARTETRYAQTRSALEIYKGAEGIEQIQMIDARLGPTDADCEAVAAMDPVSFDEALALLDEEHPNGTRDIVPVFGGDA